MGDPRVGEVIDIVRGQHVNSGGKRPHPQPVGCVDHGRAIPIGAEEIAAGIMALIELASRELRRRLCCRTRKKVSREESPAAGIGRQLRLRTVGDGNQDTVLVDAEPRASRDRVRAGKNASVQDPRRVAAARVRFFSVRPGNDWSVRHHSEQ